MSLKIANRGADRVTREAIGGEHFIVIVSKTAVVHILGEMTTHKR